jgi:hypothetical protein
MTMNYTKETYFAFLDNLRDSGKINMFGAAPVLGEVFNLTRLEAREIVQNWMEDYMGDTE